MHKKYLKTIKDIEALKDTDTKILYEIENGGVSDPREYYKFVNGVLCCFSNDTLVSYNTMLLCKRIKYYIEVEDEPSEEDIGKLGWFWDDDEDDKTMNILWRYTGDDEYCVEGETCSCYKHFRPLTPEEVEKYTGYKVVKEA